jgi:hypothetical protein
MCSCVYNVNLVIKQRQQLREGLVWTIKSKAPCKRLAVGVGEGNLSVLAHGHQARGTAWEPLCSLQGYLETHG